MLNERVLVNRLEPLADAHAIALDSGSSADIMRTGRNLIATIDAAVGAQ